MTEADVIVVGAGPTGLMLAGELCLAGLRPLVLDRLPQIRPVPRAGGLGGQIVDLLRYRGLLGRFEAASPLPDPKPRFPFGGLHIDFTPLDRSPMRAVVLPQPQLEELLGEHVRERGAELRRGHEVVGLSQDGDSVTAHVRGPDGAYLARARYLVGCDGVRSRIREMAAIAFPGVTHPEVNRLASTTMPGSVTLREDGDYDVEGYGRLRSGYTQTAGGVFAVASYGPGDLGVYTSEEEDREYDDDVPMTLDELRASIRRVLGAELPLGEPSRLTRFTFGARNAQRYRAGRVFVAGDAAHQFPSGGGGLAGPGRRLERGGVRPPGRRVVDPPGRAYRLGGGARSSRRGGRVRVAGRARPLVRGAVEPLRGLSRGTARRGRTVEFRRLLSPRAASGRGAPRSGASQERRRPRKG